MPHVISILLLASACLISCFLSAESFTGNWMLKVRMRFPLWEGSCESGIPSPVTTFLYVGLGCHDAHITDRKNNRWKMKHSTLFKKAFILNDPFGKKTNKKKNRQDFFYCYYTILKS